MTHDLPPPPPDDLLLFTPVAAAVRRHDGWTAEAQRAFVDALARTGVVAAAARSVGQSRQGAYALRRRAGPEHGFTRAWDVALDHARRVALDRAIELGRERLKEPLYRRGRQVGVRVRWDNRLLLAALHALDREEARLLRRARDPK